jgi:hypothetical protein
MAATGGAAGYDSLGVARTVIVTLAQKQLQLQQRPLMFEAVMEQVGCLAVGVLFWRFCRCSQMQGLHFTETKYLAVDVLFWGPGFKCSGSIACSANTNNGVLFALTVCCCCFCCR